MNFTDFQKNYNETQSITFQYIKDMTEVFSKKGKILEDHNRELLEKYKQEMEESELLRADFKLAESKHKKAMKAQYNKSDKLKKQVDKLTKEKEDLKNKLETAMKEIEKLKKAPKNYESLQASSKKTLFKSRALESQLGNMQDYFVEELERSIANLQGAKQNWSDDKFVEILRKKLVAPSLKLDTYDEEQTNKYCDKILQLKQKIKELSANKPVKKKSSKKKSSKKKSSKKKSSKKAKARKVDSDEEHSISDVEMSEFEHHTYKSLGKFFSKLPPDIQKSCMDKDSTTQQKQIAEELLKK